MTEYIYRRPVIFAISIDLVVFCLGILMIKYNLSILVLFVLLILAVTNRKILINGIGMKNKYKMIIRVSAFITVVSLVVYNYNEIINRLLMKVN